MWSFAIYDKNEKKIFLSGIDLGETVTTLKGQMDFILLQK